MYLIITMYIEDPSAPPENIKRLTVLLDKEAGCLRANDVAEGIYVCMYLCIYVYMYIYTNVHVCIYICVYLYEYVYLHKHISI
jgi:hypothetical protein